MKRVLNRVSSVLGEVISQFKKENYELAYQLIMDNQDILEEKILPQKEKNIYSYVIQFTKLYKEGIHFDYTSFLNEIDQVIEDEPVLITRMKKDLPDGVIFYTQQMIDSIRVKKLSGKQEIVVAVTEYLQAFNQLKQELLLFLKNAKHRNELYECIHDTMIMVDKEIIEKTTQALNKYIELYEINESKENRDDFFKLFVFTNEISFGIYNDLIETRYYTNNDFSWIVMHLQLLHQIFYTAQQNKDYLDDELKHPLDKQRLMFNRLLLSFTTLYWEKYYREYQFLETEIDYLQGKMHSMFVLKSKKEKLSKNMQELLRVKENPIIYFKLPEYQAILRKYSKKI